MIYEIDEEYLEELIAKTTIAMGEQDMIRFMLDIIETSENKDTIKYFKRRVEELSEEYHICRECGGELESIIVKEYHTELEGDFYEPMVDGYKCIECRNRVEY